MTFIIAAAWEAKRQLRLDGEPRLGTEKPTKMVISWGFCIGIPWVVENPILMEY